MTLSYDGTHYCGWQVQPNGLTIQELVEKALAVLLKQRAAVIGAGRTDAGVHALEQAAHFHTDVAIDLDKTLYALNAMLPRDIRVLSLAAAADDFHACYSALGKEYHYYLTLDRFQSPFRRLYSWHVRRHLDVERLKAAAQQFVGTHDFTSFANEAHEGCASRDPVRTIWRVDPVCVEGGVRLEFEGEGFLYKMVRNMVGVLVEVSSGKRPVESVTEILARKDRRLAGQAAPAHGLFLVRVRYV